MLRESGLMVKSQDQKLSATKGVGGRENGRGKEEKAECIYWVWVLENPLHFYLFFKFKKVFFLGLCFFFLNVLTWKIVGASKVSVLYIYR